eukprot:1072515-Heterocapsa_arctica.AAC.1
MRKSDPGKSDHGMRDSDTETRKSDPGTRESDPSSDGRIRIRIRLGFYIGFKQVCNKRVKTVLTNV